MYEDDEFENSFDFPDMEKMKAKMKEIERKKFREMSYKAYGMLVKDGLDSVDQNNKADAILAIRRILGLMVEEEQFERCLFLKNFLIENLSVKDPQPLFDFND